MDSAQYPRISKISGPRRHISKSHRKEFWAHSRIFTVLLLVTLSLFIHGVIPAKASSYQPHSSIHINGNDGFNSDNGVTGGTGTLSDPYIIQGWDIVPCCKTPGISITNTSAYFVIRNMNVHSGEYPTYGINLTNVSNGAVEDSHVTVYWWSLTLDSSKNILVSDDTVSWITINSSQGITVSGSGGSYGFGSIASSDNVTLVNDTFGEFGDFQISDSTRVTAENNTFTSGVLIKGTSPEQFDTDTITPDNIVDGRPLLFYKDCSGLNVDSVEVGELIVANCEGVKISNLTFNNICCIVETAFVSDAIVANITSNRMVLITNSSAVEVSHVRVENGINIQSTSGIQMSNNVGHIGVSDSVNVSISNNNGDLGLFTATISSSSDITISGNTFSPGCDCTGLVVDNSSHVNLSGNTFRGDEGVDVTNSGFIEISDNQFPGSVLGAIVLDSCSTVSIERNQILPYADEYHGVVRVSNCDSVNISGNTITAPSSSHGTFDLLTVSLASNITISGNNLSNSTTAVGVSDSSSVTIVGNNIQSNIQGVVLNDTENVLVFHNNFLNNTVQSIDTYSTQNAWDNGYPSGGNFWSDYTGVDNCSGPAQDICPNPDGIGDTPYLFNYNQDNYPLTKPY